MKALATALFALAVLVVAAAPGRADQTFWTLDTGKLPTPKPTSSSYPVNLQYYYYPGNPYATPCPVGYWYCPTPPPRRHPIPRPSGPRRLPPLARMNHGPQPAPQSTKI